MRPRVRAVTLHPSPEENPTMRDYPIKRPQDETACDQCGAPLQVGAIAVQRDDDLTAVYCSEGCADECKPDCWPAESAGVATWTAPEEAPAKPTRSPGEALFRRMQTD